jgi:hypothetical protein
VQDKILLITLEEPLIMNAADQTLKDRAEAAGYTFGQDVEYNGSIWAYAFTGTHELGRQGTRHFSNWFAADLYLRDITQAR